MATRKTAANKPGARGKTGGANTNPRGTVFCIHGMWGTGRLWNRWGPAFERAGYEVIAPTLPLHDIDPADPPPDGLGAMSLIDYAAFLEAEIRKLPEKPVIVGHSMGGLLAQIVTTRRVARAAVYVCPAPPAGWAATVELMSPTVARTLIGHMFAKAIWSKAYRLSYRQARYSSLNLLSEEEAREEYEDWVYESGRVLREIGFWWSDGRRAAKVETGRIDVPTLTLSGGKDRIVPKHVVDVTARKLAKRGGDYRVYPEHSHWMIREPGHEEVAGDVVEWLAKVEG